MNCSVHVARRMRFQVLQLATAYEDVPFPIAQDWAPTPRSNMCIERSSARCRVAWSNAETVCRRRQPARHRYERVYRRLRARSAATSSELRTGAGAFESIDHDSIRQACDGSPVRFTPEQRLLTAPALGLLQVEGGFGGRAGGGFLFLDPVSCKRQLPVNR